MTVERALCPVLIGREDELSVLEDALLAANRREGQVVVLTGDAGMGKTRLATELQRRATHLGMDVLWGGCSEAELALPYLPFLEAIGNYLAGADLKRLRTQLGPIRRELAHLFPQLEPKGVPPDVDSTQGRLRLYEALLALLNLAAEERGLLLLIEDLHWSDASTRELLDYLTRRLRNTRILVLATYRSDEMHRRHPLVPLIQRWRRSSAASVVELEPLTPEQVAAMVTAIFDLTDGVRDDTRDFLHARTEGNPFVLEEMLKAALDRGDIFRNAEGWTRKELDEIRLPDTVRDSILLRLDRLTEPELEVLKVAAVLGTSVSYELVVDVSGRPESEVRAAVEACVMQQLLENDSQRGRAGYRFRHALTREAVYDDVIVPVRESLHSRAADILQSTSGPPLEIGQHLLAAGRTAEAVPFCLEAAARAGVEYADADAAALYERILPFIVDQRQRAMVLSQLGAALFAAGQSTAAHRYLQAGIEGLERFGQGLNVAHYRILLGRCAWEVGDPAGAHAAFELARSELEPAGPSADLALAYVRLASLQLFQMRADKGLELARMAITIAEAAGAEEVAIQGRLYLGDGLGSFPETLDEGIRVLDACYEEAAGRGWYWAARGAFNNGCNLRTFNYRAREVLDRLPLFDRLPDSALKSMVLGTVEGNALYQTGNLPGAVRAFQSLQQAASTVDAPVWRRRALGGLANCFFGLDREAEGRAVMPSRSEMADISALDRINFDVMLIRHGLAKGEPSAAASAARAVFETWPSSMATIHYRSQLAYWCAWAFIADEQPELAARAARIGLGDGTNVPVPARAALEAALSYLAGDVGAACDRFQSALEFLDAAEYHSDACPMRRWRAGLLLKQGDSQHAQIEFQKVFDVASTVGLVVEAKLARAELEKLGVAVTVETHAATAKAPPTGERYVSVLFVDVRDYTAKSRNMAPAELADLVATFHRWCGSTVQEHRGVVDKFAGDAMMATFNTSGAHVDHAQQALACALAIRDKAGALALSVGAGIATGPAVVGALVKGANTSVLGETTNLASRLQARAQPGEVLLSGEAYKRVRDWLSVHGYSAADESLELKGFDSPVAAWRVANQQAANP